MSRRSLPLLLALLAVIALGVLWLLVGTEPRASTTDDLAVSAPESAASSEPATSAPVAPAPAPEHVDETPEPASPTLAAIEPDGSAAEREAIEEDPEGIDMTQTWSVAGRVVLPPNTPPDESVEILAAVGSTRRPKIHSRSRLAADGSFTVEFSKGAEKGQLLLESRYLHLAVPHAVSEESIAKLANPIVLRPELGGCIRGRLVLPRNALDRGEALVGKEVRLSGRSITDTRDWTNRTQRQGKIDDSLEFTIGGLPVARVYDLNFDSQELVDASADNLRVEAGRALDVVLELQLGARITGKVVDEKGAPVEGASIGVQVQHGMTSFGEADQASAKDGAFAVAGIHPGKVELEVTKVGYAPTERDLGRLDDGAVREALEIVLKKGASVTGRVEWPDRRPVAKARLDYRVSRSEGEGAFRYFGTEDRTVHAGEDGAFEISGLETLPIVLIASAEADEEKAKAAEALAKTQGGRSGPSKTAWKARLDRVEPGTKDLVITLREGSSLRGRALDDLGAPIATFTVRAEPADGTQEWERRQRAHNASGKEGAFEIEGLYAGEWDLVAESKAHAESSRQRVRVPGSGEPIDLVLPRGATLSGTVVDRDGQPASGARVSAWIEDPARLWDVWNRKERKASCDDEGKFELENVPPGPVKVVATAEGKAESEPLRLEIVPGELRADLALVVRRPGRITGEIVDDSGRPVGLRHVNVNGMEQQSHHSLEADAAGRFVVEGLPPGRYWITSQPSEKELETLAPDEDRETLWTRHQKQASARVEEGETTHVVLGGAPKDGVKLHGTIWAGKDRDRTAPGCTLWMFKRTSDNAAPITATSDGEGKYEVLVPGAGDYTLSLMNPKRGTTSTTHFTVPAEKESFEHDVVLPAGRIAGRVVGVDGKPAAGVPVSCAPEAMTAGMSGDASYGNGSTDDAGAFSFDGMCAGTYRLEAGAQDWQNQPSALGKCLKTGVVLEEDGRIANLELRLMPQCRVEGLVVGPDGRPVPGASVFARDEHGTLVQRWPPVSSDASGRFAFDGLVPGKATFSARAKLLASPESAPVTVRADETAKVEIALRTGTFLRVVVRESDDRVVGSFVTIADARGRDVTMIYGWQQENIFFGETSSGEGQKIGPLPPGRYRVTARNHGGASATEDVAVTGQESGELEVNLRFD